jgi:hypothetical protein
MKSNAARQRIFGRTDEELLDGLDDLVRDAVRGDSRAVGIIAVVYGPMLNDEARDELGPTWEEESADILQTMFRARDRAQVGAAARGRGWAGGGGVGHPVLQLLRSRLA